MTVNVLSIQHQNVSLELDQYSAFSWKETEYEDDRWRAFKSK